MEGWICDFEFGVGGCRVIVGVIGNVGNFSLVFFVYVVYYVFFLIYCKSGFWL